MRWHFYLWRSRVPLFALKLCFSIPETLIWLFWPVKRNEKWCVLVSGGSFKSKCEFQHILSFPLKQWQAMLHILYGHCSISLRPRVRMKQRNLQLTWDENIVSVETESYCIKLLKFWGYFVPQLNLPYLN